MEQLSNLFMFLNKETVDIYVKAEDINDVKIVLL